MTAPTHWSGGLPRVAGGAIAATVGTAAPDHWSLGLPFDSDGGLAVEYADPAQHKGRWPLAASGRVSIGDADTPYTHMQSGVPYTAAGRLAVCLEAPTNHVAGIPVVAGRGVSMVGHLFHAPLLVDLSVTGAGSWTPTYAGTSANRLVLDHDGVFRRVNAGEPRFWGARRVENFAGTLSGGFGANGWGAKQTAGTGDLSVDTETGVVTVTGAPGDTGFRGYLPFNTAGTGLNSSGIVWCLSFEVRNIWGLEDVAGEDYMIDITGTTNLTPDNVVSAAAVGAVAKNQWVRVATIVAPGADSNGQVRCGVGTTNVKTLGESGLHIEMRRFQFEEIGGASAQAPGEYVDPDTDYIGHGTVDGVRYFATENGNTIDTATGIVTEAAGAALSDESLKGVFFEGQGVNVMNSGKDDPTAWTDAGVFSTLTAATVAGPDGRTTAGLITETTDNAWHRVYAGATVGDAPNRMCFSACVKRANNADTAAMLHVTNGSGNSFEASFDLDDGSVIASDGPGNGTIDSAGSVALGNGWFWCWIAGFPDIATPDTAVTPVVAIVQADGTKSYVGTDRAIYFALPMFQDTGAATLVGQVPNTFAPVGTTMTKDSVIDWGDASATIDGEDFSAEESVYQMLQDAATHPSDVRYLGANGTSSNGYIGYINANSNLIVSFNGTSSLATAGDGVSDYPSLRLRRRQRMTKLTAGTSYMGFATSENVVVDGTPIAGWGAHTIGDLYVAPNAGAAPFTVSRVTFWPSALGQTWAEDAL